MRDDRKPLCGHGRIAGGGHPLPRQKLQDISRHGIYRCDAAGAKDRYGQEGVEKRKLVPEGVEGACHTRASFEQHTQLVGGLRSGMVTAAAGPSTR